MSDIIEKFHYDEMDDRLTVETSYDAQPVVDSNKRIKNSLNSKAIQKYDGSFVHAARLHEGDVIRLINMGYNLLSSDVEEYRRALMYIQENEPHLLLVHGKPFSKQKITWQ
jgi:hypothetical protein